MSTGKREAKIRAGINRFTCFLAHQYIVYITNFGELVDPVVVKYGSENLRHFLEEEYYIHIKECCG